MGNKSAFNHYFALGDGSPSGFAIVRIRDVSFNRLLRLFSHHDYRITGSPVSIRLPFDTHLDLHFEELTVINSNLPKSGRKRFQAAHLKVNFKLNPFVVSRLL